MSDEQPAPADNKELVFNGIDGRTGSYGLQPMTVHQLAEHLLARDDQAAGQRQEATAALKSDARAKILKIVRLLAESNLADARRDAGWQQAWLASLARELLGDAQVAPHLLDTVERNLARDPADQIEHIVELLASGAGEKLSALLLRDPEEAPDNRDLLKEQLKRDALAKKAVARQALIPPGNARLLAGDLAARNDWLVSWIRDLQVMPLEALEAISWKKIKPLRALNKEMEDLAGKHPALDRFCQALKAEPADPSWPALLDLLHRELGALIEQGDDEVPWPDLLAALGRWLDTLHDSVAHLGVIEGLDPTDLAQAGWGIIFAYEDPHAPPALPISAIRQALRPLLDLRRSQAGARFKIYQGADGYRPSDTTRDFLSRYGAVPSDPANPERVPYYLLIVGSPQEIPFHFQYQLDVQYAVGRIHFDSTQEYANYARSVVAAEADDRPPNARVSFFGPANHDDRTTQLTAAHLVEPLFHYLQDRYGDRWRFEAILREEATKARLLRLVGGSETPALLFAACHGIEFSKDDPDNRQLRHQGALLCQDWPGPETGRGEVPVDHYLAGEHLPSGADMGGLIAFFFACYSAGTPRFDEYYRQEFRDSGKTIADPPFLAALPKAMLGQAEGGALAVVGHVERAWSSSYLGPRQSQQLAVFEGAVERLLKGHPIGSAMEYFDGRYAALSTELTTEIEQIESYGRRRDDYALAELWTANNDARGYIIIGDPAVRLPAGLT
jgi:hypothetical protein